MSATATQTERPRRRFPLIPRTRRGKIAATAAGAVGVSGVAVAAFFALLNVSGNVSGGALNVEWAGIAEDPVFQGMDTCTIGIDGVSGDLTVNATGGFPGASCTFAGFAEAAAGSTTAVVVSGTDATGLPDGWTLNLQDGVCGTLLEGAGAPQALGLELAVPEDATVVESGSFGPGVGVTVTPANQWDPSLCTP